MTLRVCFVSFLVLFVCGTAQAARVEILEGENFDLIASTSRGLRLRFEKPDMTFRIGGRLQGDAAFFDADQTDLDSDAKLRRARLHLTGTIEDLFRFKVEREFAPDRGEFRNVWGQFLTSDHTRFKFGNFVAPLGLEQMASSNFTTFMERSLSGSLTPNFQTGGRFDAFGRLGRKKSGPRWTYALSAGAEPMGQRSDDRHRAEHWSVVTRATFAPITRKRTVVHFGGAAQYQDVIGDDTYRVASGNESSLGPRILSTGTLTDVDSVVTAGAEAAALFGPVLLQGEYHHSILQRGNGFGDVNLSGYYGQASWVLTGEHRDYSRSAAVFGGLTPKSDWGALELAARYSTIDLEDDVVAGGKATDITAGLNWYIRSNLRLMFNYVYVDAEQAVTGTSDQPHIFQFRAQLHF